MRTRNRMQAGVPIVVCLLVAGVSGRVFGQLEQGPGGEMPMPPQMQGCPGTDGTEGGGGPDRPEAMVARFLNNPEFVKELGLTQEQIVKIREGMYELKREKVKRRAELELAAMEQAELMTEPTVDEKALMKAVEKTGEMRTNIAKLQIKQILLVKNTLTSEQIEKIKERMRRQKRERFEGGARRRGEGRDQGGPEGKGRMERERKMEQERMEREKPEGEDNEALDD